MLLNIVTFAVALHALSHAPQLARAQADLAQQLGIEPAVLTQLPGRAQARLEYLRANRQRAAQAVQTPYLEIAGPGSNGKQAAQQVAKEAQRAIADVLRKLCTCSCAYPQSGFRCMASFLVLVGIPAFPSQEAL